MCVECVASLNAINYWHTHLVLRFFFCGVYLFRRVNILLATLRMIVAGLNVTCSWNGYCCAYEHTAFSSYQFSSVLFPLFPLQICYHVKWLWAWDCFNPKIVFVSISASRCGVVIYTICTYTIICLSRIHMQMGRMEFYEKSERCHSA